ncbi:FAD-binding oxidoreductase [Pantoea sp. Cy-639]|uniref:NAD(P)/FAD-dependent oxidoreductase n=1 Tax=Pantoea sp. Cy-639 TaxID=2608360 RepID=UPI0014202AA5|nr:FAD-binding oxidoreductase [Pantoea sp. Cy-639]NIF16267.1 FAD-binding oxidoreductase [Pantoea sp. Cy-639]
MFTDALAIFAHTAILAGMQGHLAMAGNSLHVVVVGAGVLGASTAWHLARQGARVTVLEREAGLAQGVTGHSYGWVGTASRLPSADPERFSLEQQALAEYARLGRTLGPLPVAAQGALVWLDSEQETLALLAEQQAAGVRMCAVARERIGELEPALVRAPELALWAPDEFALEPDLLARQLLAAAQAHGARLVVDCEVQALSLRGARICGVRTAEAVITADVVVLANAIGAGKLSAALDMRLPVFEDPAVLLRFDARPVPLRHLLYGQSLELRPGLGAGLVSAADFPGQDRLQALGQACLDEIRRLLHPSLELSLRSLHAVSRPKTVDGLPLRRFLPGVEGLYVNVAHPGVILAPLLGRLASEEILGAYR